jgi:hypothetical protein
MGGSPNRIPGPGKVLFFGSGETAASAQQAYHVVFSSLSAAPQVAILETPAGFELNSEWVAGQVAEYLQEHLQNFHPRTRLVPARARGTPLSPDNPEIVGPLLTADVIYLGAGSPTYAVRQLQGSLAWHILTARHRLGAALIFASAAVVAAGRFCLSVYEIYKVGEDLHWKPGLDLLGPYGLELAFIPHWNNTDGGARLDTSHCFMGQSRFARLLGMLPAAVTVVGIDEHTELYVDLQQRCCRVAGRDGVTLLAHGQESRFASGETFELTRLGPFRMPASPADGIPAAVWEQVVAASGTVPPAAAPPEVLALVEERQAARARRDWQAADALRERLRALGWSVRDTPAGPELVPIG